VVPKVASLLDDQTTVLSILAGVELASLRERLPQAGGWCRIMPNLAAAIGKSPIALTEVGLASDRRVAVTALMEPLGTPEWIEEGSFYVVTALACSGPAFVYRFIDALASGAATLGMDRQQAERLALATVEGAGPLASASSEGPGDLTR